MEWPWRVKLKQAELHLQRYAEAASKYLDEANVRLEYPTDPDVGTIDVVLRADSPPPGLTWARRTSLLDEAEAQQIAAAWKQRPDAASQDLRASIELREWLYAALSALRESRTPDFSQIMASWATAASRAALRMTSEGARLQAAPLIPDRLAFAAVDLLTGLDLTRLRACPPEEGGCGWLFLDHSRNNSRRWCVMADCGTAAKSRKLTARRRAERVGGRP